MNRSIEKRLRSWLVLLCAFIAGTSAAVFGHALFCPLGFGCLDVERHQAVFADETGNQIASEGEKPSRFTLLDFESLAVPLNDTLLEPNPDDRTRSDHPSIFWNNHRESGPFVVEQIADPYLDFSVMIAQCHSRSKRFMMAARSISANRIRTARVVRQLYSFQNQSIARIVESSNPKDARKVLQETAFSSISCPRPSVLRPTALSESSNLRRQHEPTPKESA
jgi:hypothetical protein